MSRRDALNKTFSEMNKRTKIMLGVLGLIVVLGAGYFFLLKPSSSPSTAAATPVPSTSTVRPTATPTPKASATPNADLPTQSDPGRDPFAPLAVESAAAADTAASVTTATAAATVTATPVPTATPTPSAATTTHALTLIGITNGTASLTVNGVDKSGVKAGSTVSAGVVCVKLTSDSIFVTFDNKAYAITIGQTVSF